MLLMIVWYLRSAANTIPYFNVQGCMFHNQNVTSDSRLNYAMQQYCYSFRLYEGHWMDPGRVNLWHVQGAYCLPLFPTPLKIKRTP